MKKIFFLSILALMLSACGPPLIFGIPQNQWDQLNQKQRSQVITGYNAQRVAEAKVAPFTEAIDALSFRNAGFYDFPY